YISFFFSSRRRHTRFSRDWSSDVCSSDLVWFCLWLLSNDRCIFLYQQISTDLWKKLNQRVLCIHCRQTRFQSIRCFLYARDNHRSEERRVGKECRVRS